ncbi:hypothetical protein FRB93_013078 [Tulasnella sp. JGI-2019a]|nr:hypothetical protein FRB93_013078 [Tulasnella sp. JGI-2019a]
MCSTSSPRPILKHTSFRADQSSSSSCHGTASQRSAGSAVRFPSSPKMSTVYWTHCPNSYDRRPIVVLPNSCALPDRGQRDLSGASSSPQMGQTSLPQSWGNHVHPSIFGRMCSSGSTSSDEDSDQRHSSEEIYGDFSSMSMVPSLTHDDVSSEESGGFTLQPPVGAFTLTVVPSHRGVRWNSITTSRAMPRRELRYKTALQCSFPVASSLGTALPPTDIGLLCRR